MHPGRYRRAAGGARRAAEGARPRAIVEKNKRRQVTRNTIAIVSFLFLSATTKRRRRPVCRFSRGKRAARFSTSETRFEPVIGI